MSMEGMADVLKEILDEERISGPVLLLAIAWVDILRWPLQKNIPPI